MINLLSLIIFLNPTSLIYNLILLWFIFFIYLNFIFPTKRLIGGCYYNIIKIDKFDDGFIVYSCMILIVSVWIIKHD